MQEAEGDVDTISENGCPLLDTGTSRFVHRQLHQGHREILGVWMDLDSKAARTASSIRYITRKKLICPR
jgi:hypothetical protein